MKHLPHSFNYNKHCFNYNKLSAPVLLFALLTLSACDSDRPAHKLASFDNTQTAHIEKTSEPSSIEEAPELSSFKSTLLQESNTQLSILANQCNALTEALLSFITSTNRQRLEQAHKLWRQCHDQYRAVSVFLELVHNTGTAPYIIQGIPDNSNASIPAFDINTRIDQFPALRGNLDAVPGYPRSGLIYSEQALTRDSLLYEHQLGDVTYVAVGLHAIEAMIFKTGNETAEQLDKRLGIITVTEETEARAVTRRYKYINELAKLLRYDIQNLVDAWIEPDAYYAQAIRHTSDKALYDGLTKLKLDTPSSPKDSTTPSQHDSANSTQLRSALIIKLMQNQSKERASNQ